MSGTSSDAQAVAVPRLRGRLHLVACGISLIGLVWLVALAHGPRALAAAWVYGVATVLLYLVSSSYHVFARGPRVREIRRDSAVDSPVRRSIRPTGPDRSEEPEPPGEAGMTLVSRSEIVDFCTRYDVNS